MSLKGLDDGGSVPHLRHRDESGPTGTDRGRDELRDECGSVGPRMGLKTPAPGPAAGDRGDELAPAREFERAVGAGSRVEVTRGGGANPDPWRNRKAIGEPPRGEITPGDPVEQLVLRRGCDRSRKDDPGDRLESPLPRPADRGDNSSDPSAAERDPDERSNDDLLDELIGHEVIPGSVDAPCRDKRDYRCRCYAFRSVSRRVFGAHRRGRCAPR
jgi:hypothetical protein